MDDDRKLTYLKAACQHVGAKLECVIDAEVYVDDGRGVDRIALVVNNGVKGCPKYVVPLVDLELLLAVVKEPVEEPVVLGTAVLQTDAEVETAILATKAAQKLADAKGVNLAYVVGTGRSGRISVGDVRQAIEEEE